MTELNKAFEWHASTSHDDVLNFRQRQQARRMAIPVEKITKVKPHGSKALHDTPQADTGLPAPTRASEGEAHSAKAGSPDQEHEHPHEAGAQCRAGSYPFVGARQ